MAKPWTDDEPFYVVQTTPPCAVCGHEAAYHVYYGPEDLIGDTEHCNRDQAEEERDRQNWAYQKGRENLKNCDGLHSGT